MKQIFCTRRNAYGHRYYLTVDHTKRIYSKCDRWHSGEEIEITQKARREMVEELKAANYKEVDYI